jgi:cardiolipin synthase
VDGDAQDADHWRETHCRLEGPAVREILGGFLENWTEATQRALAPSHVPDIPAFDDGIPVQVSRSTPTTGGTAVAELFYAAIAGAQKRLWLTTAYFTAGRPSWAPCAPPPSGAWTCGSWSRTGAWTKR